jgi:hypothetical protein
MTTTIFAFSGPSGSGKSHLLDELLSRYPSHTAKWQQFTTRPRRPGEDSSQYVFLKLPQYESMRPDLTCRTDFGGNRYGTMPEAFLEEKAILTIADAKGLLDLEEDVALHNQTPHGKEGKFGPGKVRLIKVFFHYAVSEEEVGRRGRSGRSIESIALELKNLEGFEFQEVLNTTHTWPNPTQFFESFIWPIISESGMEEYVGQIRDLSNELCEVLVSSFDGNVIERAKQVVNFLSILLSELIPGRCVIDPAPARQDDVVDAALGNSEIPSARLPEVREEPAETVVEPSAAEEPLAEAALAEEPLAEAAQPPADGPLPEEEKLPTVEAEPAPALPSRYSSIENLLASVDFEMWILQSGLGASGFVGNETFQGMFGRFLMEHHTVLADNIIYAVRKDIDGVGGSIKIFVARTKTEQLTVPFNERLVRVGKIKVEKL